MKISISTKDPSESTCGMLVCFVRQPKKGKLVAPIKAFKPLIAAIEQSGDFKGAEGQTILAYPETQKKMKGITAQRILLIGLGKKELDRESFRKAGGTISQKTIKTKADKISVVLPEDKEVGAAEITEALVEGIILGAYRFEKYKTKSDNDEEENTGDIKEVVIFPKNAAQARKGLKRGKIAAEAVCIARDMANEPGNNWTPSHFVSFGRDLAKKSNLKCTVLGKKELKRHGMNGILGVNQGSAEPPALVILEHRCGKKNAPILLLVGKGLTFDSGGISLKPSGGMQDMKYDMCGGAAVMSAMHAISKENPAKVNVIGIVPTTENMPGPAAIKPGDIINQHGGKTVEVINTDAEGRLILADALSFGVKKFKPTAIVDLATLTGAVIIGLGHHYTGLLSNNDELAAEILSAGKSCGEPAWQLPMGPEYSKQLKSDVADLKNVDKRDSGTILGAAFLENFVGDTPWVHLDIAGTAWNFTKKTYCSKGPSGVGVRTLLQWIRSH